MNILGESVRARYLQLLNIPCDFPAKGYKGQYIRMIAATIIAFRHDSMIAASADDFRVIAADAIMERIKSSMRAVNISHDVFFLENSLYEDKSVWQTGDELRKRCLSYELDGAVWFKSTELGDEKDRVIVKKTGAPTYRLPDIDYHRYKFDRCFGVLVDVFGAANAPSSTQPLLVVKA